MDDNQMMDDLFGDGGTLDGSTLDVNMPQLQHVSAPPSASLVLRMDEMHRSGCSQKLTWSKAGSIARIIDDGRKIAFCVTVRNQKDGTWSLSPESQYPLTAPDGARIVHVEFNGIGIDVAAFDDSGRLYLWTLASALGRMQPARVESSNGKIGDLEVAIGVHWLPVYPTQFRSPWITPASKIEEQSWNTHMRQRDPNIRGVHHAAEGRGALLYITKTNVLKLVYQHDSILWKEVAYELEKTHSTEDFLNHAAFGERDGTLLVATHDVSRRLRLYKVKVDWHPTQTPRQNAPPLITAVAPTLEIGHLAVEDNIQPSTGENGFQGEVSADGARLSHLHIVPPVPDTAEPTRKTFHMIMAVFTHTQSPVLDLQQRRETFSFIICWDVKTIVPTLHESFMKLKPKSEPAPALGPVTKLERQKHSLYMAHAILSVDVQNFNTLILFANSDGSVDFRDRFDMTSIPGDGMDNLVSSLPQAGFMHVGGEQSIHSTISADGSAVVHARDDGTLHLQPISLTWNWSVKHDQDKPLVEAAVVALARQYAITCCSSYSNDEVLAVLPPDLDQEYRRLFVEHCILFMNRNPDISQESTSKQQSTVIRDSLLPRALSAQLVLGYNRWPAGRDIPGKLAWANLNCRLICASLAQSLANPNTFRPDASVSLRGLVKWALDFLVMIFHDVLMLSKEAKDSNESCAAFFAGGRFEKANSPALHILLCSTTRGFVRFILTFMPRYMQAAAQVLPNARTLVEREQLKTVIGLINNLPVKLQVFNSILQEVDENIRSAYDRAVRSPELRSQVERRMLVEANIPPQVLPVVQSLFNSVLEKHVHSSDVGKVYFSDTRWLGFSDAAPDAYQGYDVIRKTPLSKEMKLRLCRRCGSRMEDIPPEKVRELPPWLQSAQRHCVCTNYWASV